MPDALVNYWLISLGAFHICYCFISLCHRRVVDPRTGATALHIAAAKGYSDVLELLLKLPDLDVDATDVDGWTPLHAAAHWAKEKPLRLLAAAGASFDSITLTVRNSVFTSIKSISTSKLRLNRKPLSSLSYRRLR